VAGLAVVVLLVALMSGCADDQDGAAGDFAPGQPDTLVVATAFMPSAGFWEGTSAQPTGGFELGLAEAFAERFGLGRVEVVEVPFGDLVAGDLGGADIAISQLTPTDDREAVLDFSMAYLRASPGVVVRPGTEAPDLYELRQLRFVAVRGSTLTHVVTDAVRPEREPLLVDSRAEALDALRDDEADALLLDLPVALGLARAEPESFEVIGQLSGVESLAVALPDGSPNDQAVDSAIRAFTADGTIDQLSSRWLGVELSQGADDIPLIRTPD
jgi:polar amino acid transport system substrate-binding protein